MYKVSNQDMRLIIECVKCVAEAATVRNNAEYNRRRRATILLRKLAKKQSEQSEK